MKKVLLSAVDSALLSIQFSQSQMARKRIESTYGAVQPTVFFGQLFLSDERLGEADGILSVNSAFNLSLATSTKELCPFQDSKTDNTMDNWRKPLLEPKHFKIRNGLQCTRTTSEKKTLIKYII